VVIFDVFLAMYFGLYGHYPPYQNKGPKKCDRV